ncbi:tripartite tricarboxylate transporter substrate-binding protein, partial [Roseomonas sp. DSM 102946]|nr:tripartite tricarboxylate transporter substrate-binding protein [Roseomonas sp. DSM 102946]
IINVIPQLDTGRLRALALLRNQRSSAMPNLPTMAEAGLQGVEIPGAIGLFAPGGTPMEVVQTLTTTVAQLMLEPANREKLVAAGNRDEMLSGAGLASQLAEERAFFAGLVRRAGVEPQ